MSGLLLFFQNNVYVETMVIVLFSILEKCI